MKRDESKIKNSILIVDDEPANSLALIHILSPDYTVYAEKNGKNALEAAEEHLPDVILLDILMPETDGYKVLKQLKNSEKAKNIPVIFITGLSDPDGEEKGLEMGAADYIEKPFNPSIVKLRVGNQIKILAQQMSEYDIMKYKLTSYALNIALWDINLVAEDPLNPDNVFSWSHEFRQMLGFTDENDFPNLLESWSSLLHPDDKERTLKALTAHVSDRTGNTLYDLEYRLRLKSGEYRNFHAFGDTLRDRNGTALRVAGGIADITEKRCLAESLDKTMKDLITALEQAKAANKAKSDFLSNMSHEMRTPLNAIIGMTTIGKNTDDVEKKDYALGKIDEASSHLLGVINDVLDMAKIEANKLELSPVEFNFDKMLQKAVSVVHYRLDEKKQVFTLNSDNSVPRFVVGDDQRLTQVITNLLSNAVKFTPEGGSISLSVFLNKEIHGSCELRVEVADTGMGISLEKQMKLFDVFEQTESGISREFGGTGLGLAISKRIIELMDGEIWVESELGKGAKFIFTVKMQRGKTNFESLLAPDVDWKAIRVLAVDDTAETCEQFKTLFRDFNIKCDIAADGFEAWELIKKNNGYSIYFIDWYMPGMDGIELTRKIKSLGEKSAVIMITSGDWERIKDDALAAGVDKHMLKPLFSSMVIDYLNECLSTESMNTELAADYSKFTGKKVLLVEDVEINREILISLLGDTGLEIDCAENGQEALDMVAANPDKYDIILMDMQMPKMGGVESTRRIRALPSAKTKVLPIIALTANVFADDIEICIDAGMNGHLGKPLDIDRVLETIYEHLKERK